jgi:hypothetical protein
MANPQPPPPPNEKTSQDNQLTIYPGAIPTTPVIWPSDSHQSNQIQQTKGSAKPQAVGVQPTTQPNQSTVAPRTTPAHVSNVRVVSRNAGGQKNITVQFNHPAGDPYFSGANVYLRSGSKQPVLVASGAKSPLTFTASNDSAPHSVHVTSVGNWGETDVLTSPAAPVKLFGPLNVSKSSGTAFAAGGGGSPTPSGGATDGIIHGQGGGGVSIGSWESDPAYFILRDDFSSSINPTAGTISQSQIGQLGWALFPVNAVTTPFYLGGAAPNFGQFGWSNAASASEAGWLILNQGGPFNGWALGEKTNWLMTWVFKWDGATGNGATYLTTKKAFYLGLTGANFQTLTAGTVSRPDTFMGLRFDTSTSAPSIGDSAFTFEVVANLTLSSVVRHNTQGTTQATTVAPIQGVWHRLDIYSTTAGIVNMVLDGTFKFSAAIPEISITGSSGGQASVVDGISTIAISTGAAAPSGAPVWAAGSVVTISGLTGTAAPLNGPQTLFQADSAHLYADVSVGSFGTQSQNCTASGFVSWVPVCLYGNDDTASPTVESAMAVVDFFSFVWNPGIGGGTGTPNPLLPRYF